MSRGQSAPARPIFIMGIERTGTSLVADLICRWGAYPGELGSLGTPDAFNPRGYFEYAPMEDLLRDVAETTGVTMWDPRFPSLLELRAEDPTLRGRAIQLIGEMEKAGRPWLWKESLLSLHMSFWERILEAPVCIMTVRNPQASARSFTRMAFGSELADRLSLVSFFLLRWQLFTLSILEYFARNPDHLVISYEELLRSPSEQVERLRRFLDRQLGATEDGGERSARMLEAIDPALCHYQADSALLEVPEATEAQQALLGHLQSRAADVREEFAAERYPIPPHYQEYLENLDVLRLYLRDLHRAS
jgi:hypothetical protein